MSLEEPDELLRSPEIEEMFKKEELE